MADYYRKRLPPQIQPMQQLPVKNYVPGVYGGFSHANPAEEQGIRSMLGDTYAAEVRNTAIRRGEAADIIAGNRARAAAESKEFFRDKGSRGIRGRNKFPVGKGKQYARTMFSFADATMGYRGSTQPGQKARAWQEIANAPGSLSRGEMSEYASLKAPSGLASHGTSFQQMAWDRDRLGKLQAKLGYRVNQRGLGRRRSRI